jgi:2-methylcitrate dehydratase PrpD
MTGLTATLAAFLRDTTLADVPPEALDTAKKAIADTCAVILAGAGSEVAPPFLHYVEHSGERGASPILGSGQTAAPELAALVNGTFGHALDFDDVLLLMPAHPSAVILPALWAAPCPDPLAGSALLEAYVLGVEVGARSG